MFMLALRDLMAQLEVYIPKLVTILVIVVGGWVLVGVMKWTVIKSLVFLKFDVYFSILVTPPSFEKRIMLSTKLSIFCSWLTRISCSALS